MSPRKSHFKPFTGRRSLSQNCGSITANVPNCANSFKQHISLKSLKCHFSFTRNFNTTCCYTTPNNFHIIIQISKNTLSLLFSTHVGSCLSVGLPCNIFEIFPKCHVVGERHHEIWGVLQSQNIVH